MLVRTWLGLLLTLLLIGPASAQKVSGCVTPKAKKLPDGHLDRRFIDIYFKASEQSGVYLKIAAPLSLYVVEEQGPWLKVAGSPSSPFKPGEELGWVKESDVIPQGLRNCN
jgi:hypothetical protein